ncbi:hypothetical protein CF319_g6776 [Tilletia indica]|nr:hypothetical protein CF319_g6776 [Tilletia indica]
MSAPKQPAAMSLRDAAARKLPARYAESELEPATRPSISGGDVSAATNPLASSSGGDTSAQTAAPGRARSPITPGPPPGYKPPTVKTKETRKSTSTPQLLSSTKTSATTAPVPAISSPEPSPVAPGPPTTRTASPSSAKKNSEESDNVREDPDRTETQALPPFTQHTFPKSREVAAKSRAVAEQSNSEEDDIDIVNEQQVASLVSVPDRGRPTPRPFLASTSVGSSTSDRRIQPDRDCDFFTRRKVVFGIEKNPPPPPPVNIEANSSSDSDEDFHPARSHLKKGQKSTITSKDTTISKAKRKDSDHISKPASIPGESSEEHPIDLDDSEEEEVGAVVDLTVSSPSSDTPAAPRSSKVSKAAKASKLTAKSISSTSKKQKSKGKAVKRNSAPPVATSSRATLPSSPQKAKSTSPEKRITTLASPEKRSALIASIPLNKDKTDITPEEALTRTAWSKAHSEANARTTAESGGLAYTAPSNPASPFYLYFDEPYLKQNPDRRSDGIGIALDCRCCKDHPYTAWRVLDGTSTSLLKSHVNTKKVQGNLEAAKVKGGISGPIERYLVSTKKEQQPTDPANTLSAMQARQISVAWVTEAARPIAILDDKYFKEWLPKERRGLVPHRNTVTKDIDKTFAAMQEVIRKKLEAVEGAIHLALDIWTSANGHSFIGVIGCWQEEGKSVRHVLDMIPIMTRHTSHNVAAELTAVLKRMRIENKVWFIASDSASTNTAMMKILGKDRSLPLIEGEQTQIRCMAHVLNLISEAIIRPFNKAVREVKDKEVDQDGDWETDEEVRDDDYDSDADDEEDDEEYGGTQDDRAFSANLHPDEAYDEEDDALIRRALKKKGVAYVAADPRQSTSSQSTSNGTLEPAADLRADSGAVGLQIRQLAYFARKLRYNVPLRNSFKKTCALFQLPKPHSLIRDVATRWNSTFEMIERGLVLWDAIVAWQDHNPKLIPAKFRIKRPHKSAFEMLIKLLEPLKRATSQFSMGSKPTIADVVGTYEDLDDHYRKIEDDEDYSEMWREAAKRAGAVCSTYYGLADNTRIFYLAVILHPNLRVSGMRSLRWEQDWIDKAEDTLRLVFDDRYRQEEPDQDSQTQSQEQTQSSVQRADKSKSFLLLRLEQHQASEQPAPDPVAQWIAGSTPVKNKLVNPLEWWWKQRKLGMQWGGLTSLALDVFSAPATSVDVERLFSKAGRHITPLRHRLKAIKLGQMVTLGGWFREDWVPEGCLSDYLKDQKQKKLLEKSKGKKRAMEVEQRPEPSKRMRTDQGTDEDE